MRPIQSDRLKRVDDFLRSKGSLGATTLEIIGYCGIASARDYVRRLRDHGRTIETVELGQNENGARVVKYVMHTNLVDTQLT